MAKPSNIGSVLSLVVCCLSVSATAANNTNESVTIQNSNESPATYSPIKPAVQFSCAAVSSPVEDKLEADLAARDPKLRLAALLGLLRRQAPYSAAGQYRAFQELKSDHSDHEAIALAREMFSEAWVSEHIAAAPSANAFGVDHGFSWAIRAAGVTQLVKLIPRLLDLSKSENLDAQLAAEKSLEEMPAPLGDAALIEIVSYWKYDAFLRAADVMVKRNPIGLSAALERLNPPTDRRFYHGLILARCGNPNGVSVLCATVHEFSMIDVEAFNLIAALGQPKDSKDILGLPSVVREDQKENARQCVENYLRRAPQPR